VTPDALIENLVNVKQKSAKNLLSYQAFTEIPLGVFLAALNIPGISKGLANTLIEDGLDTLDKLVKASESRIQAVAGFGEQRASEFFKGLQARRDIIARLSAHVTIEKPKEPSTGLLSGKSFCITGTLSEPRKVYVKLIEENGGVFKSVGKTLDYLVAGENAGSKLKKAQNGHTQVITEAEFFAMVGVTK